MKTFLKLLLLFPIILFIALLEFVATEKRCEQCGSRELTMVEFGRGGRVLACKKCGTRVRSFL